MRHMHSKPEHSGAPVERRAVATRNKRLQELLQLALELELEGSAVRHECGEDV